MSSKPDKKSDKQSYREDIEDSSKKDPGQGQQRQSGQQYGEQQRDPSNQKGGRGGEQRGGQDR